MFYVECYDEVTDRWGVRDTVTGNLAFYTEQFLAYQVGSRTTDIVGVVPYNMSTALVSPVAFEQTLVLKDLDSKLKAWRQTRRRKEFDLVRCTLLGLRSYEGFKLQESFKNGAVLTVKYVKPSGARSDWELNGTLMTFEDMLIRLRNSVWESYSFSVGRK